MCDNVDSSDLERIRLESEMALKRVECMIEFLRMVYQKEAQLEKDSEAAQGDEPKLFVR